MDQLREHAMLTESGVGVHQLVKVRNTGVHAIIKSVYFCACDIKQSVAYIHAFHVPDLSQ